MTGPGEPICDHTPKTLAASIPGTAVDWEAICCWSLAVEFQLEGPAPNYHGRHALIFELIVFAEVSELFVDGIPFYWLLWLADLIRSKYKRASFKKGTIHDLRNTSVSFALI